MARPGKSGNKAKKPKKNKECIIPPRVADAALNRFTLGRNENEAERISDYVQWQCVKDKERVTYLEKVMTEPVFGTRYDCWNVRTNKERYWVITNPTNLYSQKLFPSLDYTLSFHIGLMTRVQAQRKGTSDDRLADRLASAFRRWEQAAEALDRSEESEEIQAVGMRCRECLITLARSIANPAMVPKGREIPKAGDFIHWSELIADTIASGPSNQEIRGYLKNIARSTWQVVSWLTHASNSITHDGKIALHATYEVLNSFGAALIRSERKTLDRCPRCGSLRIGIIYKPDAETDDALCESCGWSPSL
jgi:predicted RNA-binding Zn-ribbon protein involved in translation (DUF1610 family)